MRHCPNSLAVAIACCCLALLAVAGCGGSSGPEWEGEPPKTTIGATIVPLLPAEPVAGADYGNPANWGGSLQAALDDSLGLTAAGGGEPLVVRTDLVAAGARPNRRSLLFFSQLSDVHVTDDESPSRMGMFEVTPSAFRPQDPFGAHVLDAAVRTITWFDRNEPLDFVIFTGDVVDSAQSNEFDWFISVLDGIEVDPDSGDDDDPVAGPGNDWQDRFLPTGLGRIPWYHVMGNHDPLILGNWPPDEAALTEVTGTEVVGGTRHGQTGELVRMGGQIPADPQRAFLSRTGIIDKMLASTSLPPGHGYSQQMRDEGRTWYSFHPVAGLNLRVIAMDTTQREVWGEDQLYFADGVMSRAQLNDFIIPELEAARAARELVIVASHHNSHSIGDEGRPDLFATGEELVSVLNGYPSVVLWIVGHSHENEVTPHPAPAGQPVEAGFFEVQCTALMDWPQQFRFYELIDNSDGTVSIVSVVTNYQALPGSIPATSRRYSLLDVQAGCTGCERAHQEGDPDERNVELIVPIGQDIAAALATSPATLPGIVTDDLLAD